MASLIDDGGLWRVQLTGEGGQRKTIRLGEQTPEDADAIHGHIEALLRAGVSGVLSAATAAWIGGLNDRLHARLSRAGVVPARERRYSTLAQLIERFGNAANVKPATLAAYKQTTDSLTKHLGDTTELRRISTADADRWRKAIGDEGLARATISKRVRVARAIFGRAIRWGLVDASPFADLRAGSQSNPDRAFYITREATAAVLAACPSDDWKAIVGLGRYAGLRCPSEVVALRWGDVLWDKGRLIVRSSKTEDHAGGEARVVPLAPELRAILQAAFDAAEPGTLYVVAKARDPRVNWRTTFRKIIARAGLTPWPRLFHNLRASCATDWADRFPGHAVASWCGHSQAIAATHYLQTRDSHFAAAAGMAQPERCEGGAKSGANEAQSEGDDPARNAARPDGAPTRKVTQRAGIVGESCGSRRELAKTGASVRASKDEGNGPGRIRTFDLTLIKRAL